MYLLLQTQNVGNKGAADSRRQLENNGQGMKFHTQSENSGQGMKFHAQSENNGQGVKFHTQSENSGQGKKFHTPSERSVRRTNYSRSTLTGNIPILRVKSVMP